MIIPRVNRQVHTFIETARYTHLLKQPDLLLVSDSVAQYAKNTRKQEVTFHEPLPTRD